MAQVLAGLYESIDETCVKNVDYIKTTFTKEENAFKYDKLYEVYEESYMALKYIFYRLHGCF